MKRRTIPWVITLFFLAALGCDKDKADPECKDASCCSPESYAYEEYITDIPVALSGPPYFSRYSLRFSKELPSNARYRNKVNRSAICEKSVFRIDGLSLTYDDQNEPDSFPYRVSGKLLTFKGPTLVDSPILMLYIDKISK